MSVIYLGRDNVIRYQILADGSPVLPDAVTRAKFRLPPAASETGDEVVFDTDDADGSATLQENGTVLQIKAGNRDLKPARQPYLAHITVYDNSHPDGLAWDTVRIKVTAWQPEES